MSHRKGFIMPETRHDPARLRAIGRVVGRVIAPVLALSLWVAVGATGIASAALIPTAGAVSAGRIPMAEAVTGDACAAPADFSDHQAVIDAAVACLDAGGDHIAVIGDDAYAASQFTDAVDRARSENVDLSVVILGQEAGDEGPTQVSDGVLQRIGGTVVVVTPSKLAISTDQFSQADVDKAKDAARVGDDAEVVDAIVNSLTAKPFPWLLAVGLTIAALVLLAFAGGLLTRHRRHHADAEALADLTSGLAARVNDLAPIIVSITDEVDISGRPDLEDRFAQATGDYNELRDRLAAPLPDRAAVNEMGARVQALAETLHGIESEVSTALATHRDPDPGESEDRGSPRR
jgi:hypothetical protein